MKSNPSKPEVIILGAGLSGLSLAHFLKKKGVSAIILEKKERTGGVIHTHIENGFVVEEGPNTGVVGNTAVVELFDDLSAECELETGDESAKKRYILKNGKWEAIPGGLLGGIKTPLFSWKDKFCILGEPFRPAGTNPHETLAEFVKRRMGESFLDYAINPFIKGVYAGDPNYLIPKYALPKLYNLEQTYGSLIGGSFKKSFIKKTELEKRVSRKVFSCKGGLSSLINALEKSVGSKNIICGVQAWEVKPNENGYTVNYTDKDGNAQTLTSPKLVSTLGAWNLQEAFSFIDKNEMDAINNLHYTRMVEVSLGFNKWDGMKLDGFGGLIPSKEERDILGVLFMSNLFADRAPKGGAMVTVFLGGVFHEHFYDLSDDEIKAIIERECKDLLQLKEFAPDMIHIHKHAKAIPQYGVESGLRFDTIERIQENYPGLIIAGNLRGGIGMADRIKQAQEIAETLSK